MICNHSQIRARTLLPQRLAFRCAVFGALIGLAACGRGGGGPEAAGPMFTLSGGEIAVPAQSPLRSRLLVQPVGGQENIGGMDVPAMIEADPSRVANLVAPLAGKVVSVNARLGGMVHSGQVLATLVSGDAAGAQGDLIKARDAWDLATRQLERARKVRSVGGGADKDLEAAQSAYNQAKAEFERATARKTSLGSTSGAQITLTAPRSGVVTAVNLAEGTYVSDPTAVLLTVTATDRVYASALLPEAQASKAHVGQAVDVRLTSDPDHPVQAEITELGGVLDAETRRRKARIALDNPNGQFLPNMYASVRLLDQGTQSSLWAPQSALLMNNDAVSVLVEVRPFVFVRRTVVLGDETADAAQIVQGLHPGERIVVRGGVLLND